MFLHYTWSTYHLKVNCDSWEVCTTNLKVTYKTIQIEVIANKPGNGIIKHSIIPKESSKKGKRQATNETKSSVQKARKKKKWKRLKLKLKEKKYL